MVYTVLVVDDDEVTRKTYGEVLAAKGYEVSYAKDGELAVGLYQQRPYSVVIVDLVMPKKNGFQVIEDIRKMDHNARIIAITGKSPEHLYLAEEKGANKVLVKPVRPLELLQVVNDVRRMTRGWDDIKKFDFR
ncbi:MAG TPA: response regulator [Gemmatimonadales bacterium]|jgi:DNA-binding response OmpR family regulator